MNRREFILAAGATSIAVALPSIPAMAEAAPAAEAVVETAPKGWWGFTLNDEFYHGPYNSREDALADAEDYDDDQHVVTTAFCIPILVTAPSDLREPAVEWLFRDCYPNQSLADWIAEAILGANEEADFEGELSGEFYRAKLDGLNACIGALSSSFLRHDRADLAATLSASPQEVRLHWEDPLIAALESDERLRLELHEIADAWLISEELVHAGRALRTEQSQEHDLAADRHLSVLEGA